MALLNVAKISVEKHDSKEQFLYDLDKNKSLCEVVRDVCKKSGLTSRKTEAAETLVNSFYPNGCASIHGPVNLDEFSFIYWLLNDDDSLKHSQDKFHKPESSVYGLKLIQTKDDSVNMYISESSLKDVKHMDCLKIVFSIDYLLAKRILPYISGDDDSMERDICFEDLRKLATDQVFIEKLVETGIHKDIVNVYVAKVLKSDDTKALLITIYNLFKYNGFVIDTSQDILTKTIRIVLNSTENDMENVKYALCILYEILMQEDKMFIPWKEQIIEDISLNTLTQFIWNERGKTVQYEVILLVNAVIRLCKGEKRLQLIKEMNYKQNRDNVYKYIIENSNLDKKMEHELYVLQTYLLSLYRGALETDINLNDNNLFNREDFELSADDVRRLTILMDFDEPDRYLYAAYSAESILPSSPIARVSIASIVSGKSLSSSYRSSGKSNMNQELECGTINYLTLEALRHYKKNFSKIFYQSQVEEKVYEPGIFVTSERIMKMLAKLLHIGVDPPDPKSTMYQPIVFNCSSKIPFLWELFSRSMWLLSRTRREMKVSTITDYPKVMQVLEKQLQMVLSRKPKDFRRLTEYMTEITFEEVLAKWQEEKDEEFMDLQKNNACIIELKESLTKENKEHVICQRLNILKEGQTFPKVTEKKTGKNIFVQLSRNEKELFIYDIKNAKHKEEINLQDKISIRDITHIATGLNCKHVRSCKSPSLAFSLIINSERYINFIANDEKMACYWIDAFHILTNTSRRSTYYQEELDTIVEMDVRLKLLDLQNIVIPKVPPPVPPPPTKKPSVTPRTKVTSNKRY